MKNHTFWISLDVWYIAFTVVYWVLFLAGGGFLANLLGIFVPFGPGDFLFLLFHAGLSGLSLALFLLPVMLVVCWVGEQWLRRYQLSPLVKVGANLLFLLVLTLALDLLIFHNWASLNILFYQKVAVSA